MVNLNDGNMYLINSPAGSGKTTTIKTMISELIVQNVSSKVLCITFTNRAADELKVSLDSSQVNISTIHSFVDSFFKIYFRDKEILDLYFEVYDEQIQARIQNHEDKEHINESNAKYIEKYGELSLEVVRDNLKELTYNEMPFNSLYTGGLCHDDLLTFSNHILNRYPKVKERLCRSYDYVFIDEYQDTTTEVLELFFYSLANSKTKLLLFGDKMQQIYKNYDGSFEEKFQNFNTTNRLLINYRSTQKIINVLNNIYNDPSYNQLAHDQTVYGDSYTPRIIIASNIDDVLIDESQKLGNPFILYLSNRKRFESINSLNLYNAVDRMDKYRYGGKYSAVDALTGSVETPDELLQMLFLLKYTIQNFNSELYGPVIKDIRNNRLFNIDLLNVAYKKDKIKLQELLKDLSDYYSDNQNSSIGEFIVYLKSTGIIEEEFLVDILGKEDYQHVFEVQLYEFDNLANYLEHPSVSTQHGVKGEGHDTVIFVADDSPTLNVAMYEFLKVISNVKINLTDFQHFYYFLQQRLNRLTSEIGFELDKINAQRLREHKDLIVEQLNSIDTEFSGDIYYEQLIGNEIRDAIATPQVGKMKKVKISKIFRVLNSYRLFYVGCSRARKKLTIILDEIKVDSFRKSLIDRMTGFGFSVEEK